MKTRVVHCKKEPYDVYCGRPSGFGNPYSIGKDGTREEVIAKYKSDFDNRIKYDEIFRKKILSLKGKTLGCWCYPKACHCDIIVEYLENLP